MTFRRRNDPQYPVSIIPPPRSNTYGSRLSHEHDSNDAINARLSWVKEFNGDEKSREEHAVHKAGHKLQEGKLAASRALFFWVVILFILAPPIYALEYAVLQKLFGW